MMARHIGGGQTNFDMDTLRQLFRFVRVFNDDPWDKVEAILKAFMLGCNMTGEGDTLFEDMVSDRDKELRLWGGNENYSDSDASSSDYD